VKKHWRSPLLPAGEVEANVDSERFPLPTPDFLMLSLYGDDYENASARDVYLPRGVWIDYDTGTRYEGPRMLRNFALPPGKTPFFAGGIGIVVEKKGTQLVAHVYPVASQAELDFTYPDGVSHSKLRVEVADWNKASVSSARGRVQGVIVGTARA
jgi:alpha-glucosidase (family GH31 glycosyl hydrolase)